MILPKIKHIIPALALLITACTAQDTPERDTAQGVSSPLQLTTQPLLTRVAVDGSNFEKGDSIIVGLYDPTQALDLNNIDLGYYGYNGSSWSSAQALQLGLDARYVVAAYPAGLLKDNMHVNIQPQSHGQQQEYLYAISTKPVDAYNNIAELQFRFALACVVFNIRWYDHEMAEEHPTYILDSLALAGKAISRQGVMNPVAGTITPLGSDEIWLDAGDKLYDKISAVQKKFVVIPTASNEVQLVLSIDGIETRVTMPAVEWQAGKRYVYNVRLNGPSPEDVNVFVSEASIDKRDNTTSDPITVNGPQPDTVSVGGIVGAPVDLGLSVRWADHNMGAYKEQQVGRLFFWADADGNATNSPLVGIDYSTTITGQQYDVATNQWGGAWRLPTSDEIRELVTQCTYAQETVDGVAGIRFTSKSTTGSIFLPYTGFYSGGNLLLPEEGFYWSANGYYFDRFETGDNVEATLLRLRQPTPSYNAILPVNGRRCAVRPVRK